MDQNQKLAQTEEQVDRKALGQELGIAKSGGDFLVQAGNETPDLKAGRKKRLALVLSLAAFSLAVLGFLVFFRLGRSAKVTDLDGVWVNPTYPTSIDFEVKSGIQRYNGDIDFIELAEGRKAQSLFEAYLKDEGQAGISGLADFDRYFSLRTKAVFVGITIEAYDDEPESEKENYFLLQQDGSLMIYSRRFILSEFVKSKSEIEALRYHKMAYPRVFVGKWEIKETDSSGAIQGYLTDHGNFKYASDDGSGISYITPLALDDLKKLLSHHPNEELLQVVSEEQLASIKEGVNKEGYQLRNKEDIYYDISSGSYSVLVEGGRKVLFFDKKANLLRTMVRID